MKCMLVGTGVLDGPKAKDKANAGLREDELYDWKERSVQAGFSPCYCVKAHKRTVEDAGPYRE